HRGSRCWTGSAGNGPTHAPPRARRGPERRSWSEVRFESLSWFACNFSSEVEPDTETDLPRHAKIQGVVHASRVQLTVGGGVQLREVQQLGQVTVVHRRARVAVHVDDVGRVEHVGHQQEDVQIGALRLLALTTAEAERDVAVKLQVRGELPGQA